MSFLSKVVDYDMKHGSSLPSHVYMDVNITNNSPSNLPVPISFQESRNTNIIEDASLYYLSIIRWHIDTLSLPIWCPQIQINNEASDPNLTIYSFTLKYKTYVYRAYLQFVPQDESVPVPTNVDIQDLDSGYYFVYSSCYVADLLNATLQSAFTHLSELVTAGSDTVPTSNCPFLYYDPSSSSLSLFADVAGFSMLLENPIEIYCNTAMYNMLSGFEFIKKGYNQLNGSDFKFNIRPFAGNTNISEFDTWNAVVVNEEYSSSALWNPVQSIAFTTNNIPIIPTIVSSPLDFNSSTGMNINGSNNTQNIITDMEMALQTGKEYLPSVNYQPFQ